MKRFFFKIMVYSFLVFLIGNTIAFISLHVLGKSNLYKPQFVKNGVKETHFDYVVLGSSTGLTTLDTKQIDSVCATRGLNISMDDSALSSHFLMLEYFYQQKKTTNYLVLAVTPWDLELEKPILNDNDYRFLTEINDEKVWDYYKTISYKGIPILKYSKFFPLIGVSYYNTEIFYPSIFSLLQPQKRNRFDEKGNYSYPNLGMPEATNNQIIKSKIKNPYFYKLKRFCKQKKIALILYQSPMYKAKVTYHTNEKIINHSTLLSDKKLFYDNLHVNALGRKKCTEAFTIQIKEMLDDNCK